MTTYLNAYEYQSDFNNGYTLTGVNASTGNMIIVACQGRENAGVFGFATPSWNGETFTPVSELTAGLTGLHVYKLIAASSGSFNISASVDEFAGSGYGGITAVALVASGSFDGSSIADLVTSYWDTGAYSAPSQNVANAVSGDLIVSILAAPKQNNGGIDVATTYTANGTIRAQAETAAPRVGDLYIATHTGTGTVTTTYTRSDSDEPVWRMASFRITEIGGGGPSIDSVSPNPIRVGEAVTIATTGLDQVTAIELGELNVAVSLPSGDGSFDLPPFTSGATYTALGVKTLTAADEVAMEEASTSVVLATMTGYTTRTISSTPIAGGIGDAFLQQTLCKLEKLFITLQLQGLQ